jgi:hypothetical protein
MVFGSFGNDCGRVQSHIFSFINVVIPLKPKVPACEGEQCVPWDLIGVRCLIETVGFEPSEDILWGLLGESEMELTPSI